MCRYRTRDDDASLFLPPPPSIPLYSSFFRSSSPWATWSRSSRYGNRAESRWELTPSLFSLSLIFYRGPPVFLSLPLFVTYSTRILPPFLSLSLFVPRSCRSRSHLSLIRPACQPALSFSSLFSPFPLPVARSR